MNFCNATEISTQKTHPLNSPSTYTGSNNVRLHLPQSISLLTPRIPPILNRASSQKFQLRHRWGIITSCASAADCVSSSPAAATFEIEMERNKEGVYAPRQKKVVILWDLDNKPPSRPPYEAAIALREFSQRFGHVSNMSAYANRHAFQHLPGWVREERRERRRMDSLEHRGLVTPSDPYICSVCGRKCRTNIDLKKHFKQLHERERQKKVNRMKSLKGKKRERFRERYITGNTKYEEAARNLLKPRVGYGLEQELRRAGFLVKTVEDKPQAADQALKKQIKHSMNSGVDWLCLVSDDSDFSATLRKARAENLGTVVVGDRDRALGRHADYWVSWGGVQNGAITESDLNMERGINGGDMYCDGDFDDGGSDFSDGEDEGWDDGFVSFVSSWDSEEEEDKENWEEVEEFFI